MQASINPLFGALGQLAPVVRAHADEAERQAQLSAPVVRGLVEAGLFRLWIPRRYGGLETPLPDAIRVYEAAARIDGSFGWAVMIGSGGGLFAAYLEPGAAERTYARRDAVIAGSGAPTGQAERTEGGYRVSGRWRYASGAHYATRFTANCVVLSNGQPVLTAQGPPLIRAMSFDPSQVSIRPTWDTSGMRGTGSHDFEVENVLVDERDTFSVFTDASREHGALYQLPFGVLTELPVAAVALGVALHALEAFATLARAKKGGGSGVVLSDEPAVQTLYAESHARCHSARARLHELAGAAWATVNAGRVLTPTDLAEITAGSVLGVSDLCAAVGQLARAAGMSAVMQESEFARAWRDLQAVAAHVSVSPRQLPSAGAALLAR